MWKSKQVINEKGRTIRTMICQNSEPENSKWGEFAPEDGPCSTWVPVGETATAVLCSDCTQRSVNNVRSTSYGA
jgi:hypothetical protein